MQHNHFIFLFSMLPNGKINKWKCLEYFIVHFTKNNLVFQILERKEKFCTFLSNFWSYPVLEVNENCFVENVFIRDEDNKIMQPSRILEDFSIVNIWTIFNELTIKLTKLCSHVHASHIQCTYFVIYKLKTEFYIRMNVEE